MADGNGWTFMFVLKENVYISSSSNEAKAVLQSYPNKIGSALILLSFMHLNQRFFWYFCSYTHTQFLILLSVTPLSITG